MADYKILVCDDDETLCYLLKETLVEKGFDVDTVYDGKAAITEAAKNNYDVVLLDLNIKHYHGKEVLKIIKENNPLVEVIILTGESEIATAVECTKLGAFDYKTKPYNTENLLNTIYKAIELKALKIKNNIVQFHPLNKMVWESKSMQDLISFAKKAAQSDTNILIEGETGTGKELLSEFIHNNSPRSQKPFVIINCASIPDQLLESELFGYEKGAFTDAKTAKPGLVEIANGGTLFLDEIGEMSLSIQPKLLRFIENGEYRRVGGVNTLNSNVKVIAATNRNLLIESENNRFRRDLLFRLNVITLKIPPLRERKEDIILLADHFLMKKSPIRSKKILTEDAKETLLQYNFPGNVRELQHIIERAIIFSEGNEIKKENLFIAAQGATEDIKTKATLQHIKSIEEIEKEYILTALEVNKWDRTLTSMQLGISIKTLYTKIKKYGLKPYSKGE